MFKTRALSGIALVILVLFMNLLGGWVLDLILYLIAVQGLFEFYRALGVYNESEKKHHALEIIGYIGTTVYYIVGLFMTDNILLKLMLVIIMTFVAFLAVYVFTFPKYDGVIIMKAFFGFMYVPVMLQFISLTRELEYGAYLVWLIYISSWICDTCAYLSGMLLGKHKLAPILSPKKSVEGAVGGVIGSGIVAALFAYIFKSVYGIEGSWVIVAFIIIGMIGAAVSQVGDLAASAFKRNNDIKDYGKLIPGHGGILDRFDSVIFTSPMIYFLAVIFLDIR